MSAPIISIITPSYNRANIIDETAESIFNQTYPHWEWIIVDDGSTDNTWEILNKYALKDARVKIFKRTRSPKGAAACRNIALENSTGSYLIFLDTDDLLASFCIEQRVKAANESPDYDFLIFPMLLFKNKPDDVGMLWNIDKDEDEINRLLWGDPLCQGTGTIWKRESFIKAGMWNEHLLLWQDIELHLRSLLNGLKYKKRMELLPDIFLRISNESLSRTDFHSLPKLKSRMQVYFMAVEKIIEIKKMDVFIKAVRHMGASLIISAINSNQFDEAKKIIVFSTAKSIFFKKETDIFLKYLNSKKLKLHKIFFAKKINKMVDTIVPKTENTLGTVKYSHPIIF